MRSGSSPRACARRFSSRMRSSSANTGITSAPPALVRRCLWTSCWRTGARATSSRAAAERVARLARGRFLRRFEGDGMGLDSGFPLPTSRTWHGQKGSSGSAQRQSWAIVASGGQLSGFFGAGGWAGERQGRRQECGGRAAAVGLRIPVECLRIFLRVMRGAGPALPTGAHSLRNNSSS
jgi:hypothetical protein